MKTVLISGGSRGIGRACVERFAKSGFNTVFFYRENREAADEVAKSTGALAMRVDISDPCAVKNSVSEIKKRFGGVDILINNAGVSQIGLIQDTSDSDMRRVIDTNLCGAFTLCREVVAEMIAGKFGRIINIGSVWGRHGASCEVAYSASKAGLRGLTSALAKELGPSGITVNCVEPGVIMTDMNAHFDFETLKGLAESTALMRLGEASEVAEAVYFLASDSASFITGQFLGVDGGFPL